MPVSLVKFHPVTPAWPIRRRRPEFKESPEGENVAESASGAQTSRPQFHSEQREKNFDDLDHRRRSRDLGRVPAHVAFQVQQYAQEHLGQGLHYEAWQIVTAAYARRSRG